MRLQPRCGPLGSRADLLFQGSVIVLRLPENVLGQKFVLPDKNLDEQKFS